jgi:hypothetical protein
MEYYPYWLIIAGAVLLAIGFIGLAFHRNRDVEPNDELTQTKANGERGRRESNVATLPPWPWRLPHEAR